ncbi:hypothetical protein ACN26P_003342 [Vibrio cholerae]|nr:hypothetical protein [Vibrio cholerae]
MSISFLVEKDQGKNRTSVTEFSNLKEMRSFLQANAHSNFNVEVNDGEENLITLPSKCYWKNGVLGAHPTLNEMLNG